MVMHVELQATCSALGYHEGTSYIKEPDCLETVKELIRFLRREDDTCDIRRQLGHAQILQKDLLPLVKEHHDDKPLFDTVIRLLVNLTQPVLVCFNNQLPDEKTLRHNCLEIESHLQQYKEAFVDEDLFTMLTKKMTELLELDWEHRHEEDKLNLERIMVLVRNVLHIAPDPATEQRTDDDASLHDQILWAIHVSGMEDLLLYIASSETERQLCMHILEIVSLMFREQSPEILAFAGVQRSVTEKEKDERELEVARNKEKAQKKSTMLRFNTRHSNFGGTYVMLNTKSLGERELIYHRSVQDADNFTLDTGKKRRKRPKNRQPIKDTPVIRRSTLSIRLGLKEFCVQFLENAYNALMHAVKDNLQREATQELDETYYLWSMQFFMEFCRHHSGHVDFVSETMSVTTFHYIYNNLLRYYEMIMVEKKEAIAWGRRVHLALRAYQELLMTLDSMDKSNNPHLRDSSRVIKSNVFYTMEFRDIFITLLRRFNETKNSRCYLKDLVESTHLFLRMLEKFTKTNNHLVVQGNKRKKKAKKAKKAAKKPGPLTEAQLEDVWLEVSSELSALIQGREDLPQGIAPFDAASEVEVDQQRVDAMVRIQTALRQKQAGEAVAIFRAAREVWPERNEFGSQDISAEEEFMALREICMAPLPGAPTVEEPHQEEGQIGEGEEEGEDEEEAAAEQRGEWEQEFNFIEYIMHYAKPEIVKAYVLLAADFEKNSVHTNHCVVKMLHRVGFDLHFPAMLFQASLFRVFQKLMHGPNAQSKRFQELFKLGVHVVRKFSEVAEKNKKVFMEMFFWKGNKEAMLITEGYDFNPGAKAAWTEEDETELTRLFEDFTAHEHPEKDTVDLIMDQWSGATKTRGQIIRQLKNLRLIESVKDIKKKTESRGSRVWTMEDEDELKSIFTENKDVDDPLATVILALSKKRSRKTVTEKLLTLGLVEDRKQLYKKRQSKSGGSGGKPRSRRGGGGENGCWENEGEEREIVDDWSDEDDAPRERRLPSDEEILSSPTASDASSGDDDSSDDHDDDDNDNEDGGDKETVGRTEASSSSSSTHLLTKMMDIVDKGYQSEVVWIHRLISQNAASREGKDKTFSVPIVPLTEEKETAMEDPVFMDFLRDLGLSAPANEQEMFWRIPAELTAAHLRTIAQGIELDDEGKPVNPDALSQIQSSQTRKAATGSNRKAATGSNRKSKDKKKEKKKKRKKAEEDRGRARLAKKNKDKENRKEAERKKKESKKDNSQRRTESPLSESSDIDTSSLDDDDDEGKGMNEVVGERSSRKTSSASKKRGSKRKVSDDSLSSDSSLSPAGSLNSGMEGRGGEEEEGERPSKKAASASQRREALKAMLERRNGKSGASGKRSQAGDAVSKTNVDESDSVCQPAPERDVDQLQRSDVDMTPTKLVNKSKKRVKRVMDSDSDSDGAGDRLVIDDDEGSNQASPVKASKRRRLLDSNLSNSEKEGEGRAMDTSGVTYQSDEEGRLSQSQSQSQSQPQSQSQGLLDFGDEEDDASDKTKERKSEENVEDDDSSSDDDVPLTGLVKRKAPPESFPATMLSQGTPASDDSDVDDHVPLRTLKKTRRVISDDEDD